MNRATMVSGFAALFATQVSMATVFAQVSGASANDIVCQFKYRVGAEPWVLTESSATTRIQARKKRNNDIDYLEKKAKEAGLSFDVRRIPCRDPWGGDSGKPDD
ncbi:MAG: hypothetical protein HC825_00495 [Oscillatoriales cyanobacterium RM1_1_9]|nr:hypothetical protein [Oscillatoriales cyanobacterium SM2_3_0]NJO45086.1 hypothetical protein [Oscillatoriales cyanobacterium RM2_1_1]NJO70591.1 hypothetical protein [Oscillatoriales cyanobacterium RM1_1_9]